MKKFENMHWPNYENLEINKSIGTKIMQKMSLILGIYFQI